MRICRAEPMAITPLPPVKVPDGPNATREGFFDILSTGLLYYCLTSMVAVLGVIAGHEYMKPAPTAARHGDLLEAFGNWDGRWYRRIAVEGYQYNPKRPSNIAFFPAFPLLGRGLASITGWCSDLALLLVAHVCLPGPFVVLPAS